MRNKIRLKLDNKTKIFLGIFVIFSFVIVLSSYAEDKKPITMSDLTWYSLYQKNVTDFCQEYKSNNQEIIYTYKEWDNYLNLHEVWVSNNYVNDAKKKYEATMDNIYSCATNLVDLRAYKLVKDELIKNQANLNAKLKTKLDNSITSIENYLKQNNSNCKINSEKNEIIIKSSVLNQVTYEYCRYAYYLEYLKEFSDRIDAHIYETTSDNSITISNIVAQTSLKQSEIQKDLEEAQNAFPIVYRAFSDYENNMISHIMLELLREDYMIFRDKLHQTLTPLNQVVYKISNATRQ